MMLSNVIVDVTISRRALVFGELRAYVSAGFTNVGSLAVAEFDLSQGYYYPDSDETSATSLRLT